MTVSAAKAALDAGSSIGRQWTSTGLVAWIVDPDGAPNAPLEQQGFPATAYLVGDEPLPASEAGAAFDLAASAGSPLVGLGASDDVELAAVSGLVGAAEPVVFCDAAAAPATVICADLLGVINIGRLIGYRVIDHGTPFGDVDTTADSTGKWQIATWTTNPPSIANPSAVTTTLPAAPGAVPAAQCEQPNDPGFTFPIRRGDSGETVRSVQGLLSFLGYDLGPSGADGQYGAATEAAVRAYKGTARVPGGDQLCMEDYFLMVQLTESGEGDGDGGG